MKKDQSFHDYVKMDLLQHISGITSRAMFGGWAIYKNGIIFAIIVDGELYFKVDDSNRSFFEKLDSHPFIYRQGKKSVTMSYWTVPSSVLEDRDLLSEWVDRSAKIPKKKK